MCIQIITFICLKCSLDFLSSLLQTVQILCCLMISSLGAILVFAPYPSHFSPAISTTLMSGYPFLGALCVSRMGTVRGDMLYKR